MIGILRCVDGQLMVNENCNGSIFIVPEQFTTPMPEPVGREPTAFDSIERIGLYSRKFKRAHTYRTAPKWGEWGGDVLAFLYLEEAPGVDYLPPEILSRRMQEVESEWLRLGRLLDDLRALESGGAR
jgi:hypothetical protein